MAERPDQSEQSNVSESLRTAIERTFAATAESASEAGGRAQERASGLLDEVTRRGQEARAEAGNAAARVVEAVEGMRLPSREDIRALETELGELRTRIERLESKSRAES